MRYGKGFRTIEKYTDIININLSENCGMLLECIGNLCANEMFAEENIFYPAEKIVSHISALSVYAEHMVIISNDVSRDILQSYSPETQLYIKAMTEINSRISDISDNVIECVYGIPAAVKGGIPC